jgi:DNA-binding transcriptional MerR regulator
MSEEHYQINDLEKLTGIKAHTIRIWEKRYGLLRPKRTNTNIRYYNAEDLRRLLNITLLNRNGFKISRIAELNDHEINEKVLTISNRNSDVEDHIQNLIMAMFHLNVARFEKLYTVLYINRGFESTFNDIIWPFLSKVGLLWQTGTISVAHEHFATNLIRQKLMVAIDNCLPTHNLKSKKYVLFLPENEYHELGLLYAHYLLKQSSHNVTYLGASLPLQSINEVNIVHQADYLVVSFTSAYNRNAAIMYLETLSGLFAKQKIIAFGPLIPSLPNQLPQNIMLVSSASELLSIV